MDKHSSLLGLNLSFEENELLWIWPQVFIDNPQVGIEMHPMHQGVFTRAI